jgi:hypothetical protein
VITNGHFSHYVTIPIVTSVRPCTTEEQESDLAVVCMFLGGIPVIKLYESQLITSTIMAGSSGSPVFNANGEIGGLVFAGAGDLSYGFIVPQEYVKNFVENEAAELEAQTPKMEIDLAAELGGSSNKKNIEMFLEKCREGSELSDRVTKICNSLHKAILQQ